MSHFAPARRHVGWALAGLAAAAQVTEAVAPPRVDRVEALIERKTQEFSDASLKGDRSILARDLARDVAFTNENGSTPTKAEIVERATRRQGPRERPARR